MSREGETSMREKAHPSADPVGSRGSRARQLYWLVWGLVLGAFGARLGLEAMGRPLSPPLIFAVTSLCMAIGAGLAWRLDRAGYPKKGHPLRRSLWTLSLLGLYLFWPQRQPFVALLLLTLAGITIALDSYQHAAQKGCALARRYRVTSERAFDALTFFLALLLYVVTTAPDVLPADSGEFQIVASVGGVAHPPGYPLYTMIGWLFTRLVPVGNEAYRLNMMSALLAAASLTLIGAATRRWARKLGFERPAALIGGVVAALTLGTATTFWSQATIANIRMPTVLAAALALYALARFADAPDQHHADRAVLLLALAMGLGIGHHPSLVFVGIFFVVYLALTDPRFFLQPRRWWKPLLVVVLSLLPLLYLPLRGAAGAPLSPPGLNEWDGFVHHVTAQGFEGDMFAFANAEALPHRLTLVPTLFLLQFNRVLLVASVLGLLVLAWLDWRLLILLAGGLILHTFVSITYRAPQTVEYMMPAYLPIAVSVGMLTAWFLSSLLPRRISGLSVAKYAKAGAALLAAAVLLAGLVNGLNHAPSFLTLADDHSTREMMESILGPAPANALILADWRWATPLWYLQWVEGQRPDVDVQYVYPVPGQEYGDTWRDRIDAVAGQQPLLLTHAYEFPEYTLEPFGWGFWIHERPFFGEPAQLNPREALFSWDEAGSVRLLGYQLRREQASPGQALEVTLAWQAESELAIAPSFTVGLVDQEGRRLTQTDRYLGTGHTMGEVRFERLVLPLYADIPTGNHTLTVQVYSPQETGFHVWPLVPEGGTTRDVGGELKLTTLTVQPNTTRPVTLHPLAVPVADGPVLTGVDYDRSFPGSVRLYLHLQGPVHQGEQLQIGEYAIDLPELSDGAFQTFLLDLPQEAAVRPDLTVIGHNDQVKPVAGPWGWPLEKVRLPTPSPTARFVPLADEMALVGVAPSSGETFAPGDELPLRLDFIAFKPLVDDYATSVRLMDGTGQWHYLHDMQPGLGAIPTLKWIRGSRVIDPHPLPIPLDMDGEVARAALVVYERFRGTTLPPMDPRLIDVPLGEWGLGR